jgi:dTMP kinase
MKFTPRRRGVFIVVEGVDGAGKSTALKIIAEQIKQKYPQRNVVCYRTPNGPIREVLLNRTEDFPYETELLLYIASHVSTYANYIRKALDEDAIVICDRFIDSTRAYQGYGRNLHAQVKSLVHTYLADKLPDHTIYIQADPNICQQRIAARGNPDFMDSEKAEFKMTVNQGMREICAQNIRDTSENRFSLIINNTTLDDLILVCKLWVDSIMGENAPQHHVFDASQLPPVVLPKITLSQYLNTLRECISIAYMCTSKKEGFMSKPEYVSSWRNIVDLTELTAIYKYEVTSRSIHETDEQPFPIDTNSLYCGVKLDNFEIITNLTDEFHPTYWRYKLPEGMSYWCRWDIDLTLPVNPYELKELLENYI